MTNMRIVYDASTKFTGPVLNNCLHAGPLLLSEVPNVLARFRYHLVVLVAGIEKEYKQFVENRVKEIRQNVPPEVWNHCSGSQNPTDLPSCGMGSDAFKQSQIWWHSPFWPVK